MSNDSKQSDVVWIPSEELRAGCALTAFMRRLASAGLGSFDSMESLHEWSVREPTRFWSEVASFVGLVGEGSFAPLVDEAPGPTPLARRWFPGFRLNFAENLLSGEDSRIAITSWSEDRARRTVTLGELRSAVRRVVEFLRRCGVGPNDRVFAYLPNIPESIVCMLAAATLGATWSSCGTDYQEQGVIARMERVRPTVCVGVSSYLWRGSMVSVADTLRRITRAIPSVKHLLMIDHPAGVHTGLVEEFPALPGVSVTRYSHLPESAASQTYERFSFSHPLYIMFSSGTTGKPKAIVHGAGGTLLEHKKEMILHSDVRPGDRVFYQTSTSWMMWNWVSSALACGASVVMYDGDPMLEAGEILWRLADEARVTHFGTSAAFLGAIEKQGVRPKGRFALQSLRAILSTGSTLYPSQYDYIVDAIKPLWIQSISGGTDIIGCFGLGSPLKPVVRGEAQSKSLGYDVRVFNERGERVINEEGELVCAAPAPSMPICFLDDPDGELYRGAYFSDFPGVWRHGDFLKETSDHGLLFLGRSDATLKPAGVRVATADIYAALGPIERVRQALAVGYTPEGGVAERIVLFVVLASGDLLSRELEEEIRATLRRSNTFYVPAVIIQAPDVPRTSNNKLSELTVKRALRGEDPGNLSALANPECVSFFVNEARSLVASVSRA